MPEVIVSDELREKYPEKIDMFEHGFYDHFEKLKNHSLYSLEVTGPDRLLMVRVPHRDKNREIFAVVDEVLNHDYDKSPYMDAKVLETYKENKLLPSLSHILASDFDPVKTDPCGANTQQSTQSTQQTAKPKKKIDSDRLFFHNGFHLLSKAQRRAIRSRHPLIVSGPPGSGKTIIGINILLDKACNAANNNERVRLVYVTKNPKLAQKMKEEFWNHPRAKGLKKLRRKRQLSVEFVCLDEFLGPRKDKSQLEQKEDKQDTEKNKKSKEEQIAARKAANDKVFIAWLSSYKKTIALREKHKSDKIARIFDEVDIIAKEFRNIAGKTKQQYLELGIHQTLFPDPKHRKALFDAFEEYCKAHPTEASDLIPVKGEGKYDCIVMDEAQDATGAQIQSVYYKAKKNEEKKHQVVFLNSLRQRFEDPLSNQQDFSIHLPDNEQIPCIDLSRAFRSPPAVTDFINHIFKLKHDILKTYTPKPKQDPLLTTKEVKQGKFEWLKTSELKPYPISHRRLVITNEKDKERARSLFNTSMVATIEEVKGLEFEELILFNFFFTDEMWASANLILENNNKEIDKLSQRRDASSCFNISFDKLASAVSRTTLDLSFVNDDDDGKHQTLLCKLQEKKTLPLEANTTAASQPEEKKNIPQENKSSTPEELFDTAKRAYKNGLKTQAENILRVELQYDENKVQAILAEWAQPKNPPNKENVCRKQKKSKKPAIKPFIKAQSTPNPDDHATDIIHRMCELRESAFFGPDNTGTSAFQILIINSNSMVLYEIFNRKKTFLVNAIARIANNERIAGIPPEENNTLIYALTQKNNLPLFLFLLNKGLLEHLTLEHLCCPREEGQRMGNTPVEKWAMFELAKTDRGCEILFNFFQSLSTRELRPELKLVLIPIFLMGAEGKSIANLLTSQPIGKKVLGLLTPKVWNPSSPSLTKTSYTLFAGETKYPNETKNLLEYYTFIFDSPERSKENDLKFCHKDLQINSRRAVLLDFLKHNPKAATLFTASKLSICSKDEMPTLYYLLYSEEKSQILKGIECVEALLKLNQDALKLTRDAFFAKTTHSKYNVFFILSKYAPDLLLKFVSHPMFTDIGEVDLFLKMGLHHSGNTTEKTETAVMALLESADGLEFFYQMLTKNYNLMTNFLPTYFQEYPLFQTLVQSRKGCDILYLLLKNNEALLHSVTEKMLQQPLSDNQKFTPAYCIIKRFEHEGLCLLLGSKMKETYQEYQRGSLEFEESATLTYRL